MVLIRLHSPVKFIAFEGVGSVAGVEDFSGTGLEGFVSGVAVGGFDVPPSAGEYHLFIPNRNATAPPPSITAKTIMAACKTQRYREREDCGGLEGASVQGIVGRAGDTKVGTASGSA